MDDEEGKTKRAMRTVKTVLEHEGAHVKRQEV